MESPERAALRARLVATLADLVFSPINGNAATEEAGRRDTHLLRRLLSSAYKDARSLQRPTPQA